MGTALIVAAICLVMEAFFSGSEIAVVAADRLKIRQGVEEGRRSAILLQRFLGTPQRLLATTLMGTQTAVVTSTITVTLALSSKQDAGLAELLTLAALTPTLVILGEIMPKSLAHQHADRLAPRVIYPLWIASLVFTPFVAVMTRFSSWVTRLLKLEAAGKLVTREELELVLSKPRQGSGITEGERRMIARIFDFGDLVATDVMVPLSSVAAIDEATLIDDAVHEVEDKGYTRFPVYRERIDRIVGVVHAFDLLKAGRREAPLGELMHKPPFVPESQPAIDLLVELQRARQGMAVVVDEYGGAVGVVTIEDILEEIVGDIDDEYDVGEAPIRREAEGLWRVRALTPVREVNRALKLDLPEGDDYETVGGLILDRLKHIPRVGESVREGQAMLRVTGASERAVEEIQIRVLKRR